MAIFLGTSSTDAFIGGLGLDTVDYSLSSWGVVVDLENGVGSSRYNSTVDHLVYSLGDTYVSIENVVGTDHSYGDTLYGNDEANGLFGRAGRDILEGGAGADHLDGGYDWDYASYSRATSGITLDLVGGVQTGDAAGDTFISIEGIQATAYDDTIVLDGKIVEAYGRDGNDHITGSSVTNWLFGENGDDTIYAGAGADSLIGGSGDDVMYGEDGWDTFFGDDGADHLDGGAGVDTVNYSSSSWGVVVDLENGVGGSRYNSTVDHLIYSVGDTYVSIENVIGTDHSYGDTIYGDASDNALYGRAGRDILEGGAGADHLDGGADWDYASYSRATSGITLDLVGGVQTGDAAGDVFVSIEGIQATAYDDTIVLNTSTVEAYGRDGNDHITGSSVTNWLFGENGDDTIYAGAGADSLIGGSGDDVMYGEDGWDTFFGDDGADHLDGGAGVDTVNYSSSSWGVVVDLENGVGSSRYNNTVDHLVYSLGDTYVSIENVVGTDHSYGDTLYGNDEANGLFGRAGRDILEGGAGADHLDGGADWDYASYSRATSGITLDLVGGVQTGDAAGDVFVSIEGIQATAYDDTIVLNTSTVEAYGRDGNDHITGSSVTNWLYGENGDDAIYGAGGNDSLEGGAGNDTLYGEDGLDLLWGNDGADTFVFEAGTAYNDVDVVKDFSTGEGDILDLSDLVTAYDSVTDAITDFIQITDNGVDSTVAVDADGLANGVNFVTVASIEGVVGLTDEDALVTSGNIAV